ncbi:hypothetical protein OAA90_06445 [Salibacteraceae bacterium]|nr:hypothetical protein [Salibacteraceae bacterium]
MELIVDDSNSVRITWEQIEKRIDGFILINNNYPNSSSFIIAKDQNIFTDNSTFMIQNCGFNFDYSLKAFAGNNESSPTRYYNCVNPFIKTKGVSNVSWTSASIEGDVLSLFPLVVKGFCWSTRTNPTIHDSKVNSGNGTGVFTSSITGLTLNTTYYVRAFATNSAGTAYGNQISFTTTPSINLPSLLTTVASYINQTSAQTGGNITNNGGSTVSARGVCYSTSQNPTTANSVVNSGNGTGVFTSSITALTPNTTYYVRAFATSSAGTAYGNQISFTTTPSINLPSLLTTVASYINQTSAQTGGNITNNGGSTVSARGVCYSTSQNPTTANSVVNSGNGTGVFTSSITALTPNTTYYVRAFATSSAGTAYGNQISFTTSPLPSNTCTISASTTGTNFTMQTTSQSYFRQGASYTITMYSSRYSFGQAATSALYDGNVYVYSFGNSLLFTSNTRTFTLPNSIPSSNCYNIRITKGSDLYVSPAFIIVP